MRMRLLIIVIGGLCLADAGQASIIFRPGEKVKYVAPGEEEISGTRNSFSTRHKRRRNKEIWAAQSRFILTFCGSIPRMPWLQAPLIGRRNCSSSRVII